MDNFFRSEEHLNEWLKVNRGYEGLTRLPVKEFLERLQSDP